MMGQRTGIRVRCCSHWQQAVSGGEDWLRGGEISRCGGGKEADVQGRGLQGRVAEVAGDEDVAQPEVELRKVVGWR